MTPAVETADRVTPELVDAFARLVPQLTSSNPPPTDDHLSQMIGTPGTTIFVARVDERIVGVLTLVTFLIPTSVRAWIEDVIVDREVGGRGIGEALVRAALAQAATTGARTVDLTSRPSREAANHLYRKVGFELRETNCYRYTLSPD